MAYAKELIISEKGHPTGHIDALQTIEDIYGQGYVVQYDREDYASISRENGSGKRADRRADPDGIGQSREYLKESQAPKQAISSAGTSIKQIPALFKHKSVKFGAVNIDIGGGRFDLATDYLASIGTTNLVFDPFNRPEAVNSSTLDYLREGNRADTATCANVLNVIAEEDARKNVILEVAKAIKSDGTAYFMVYEGNGTGVGKETSAGYQNNRKTADYVQEIAQWFDSVQRSGKLITATKPKGSLPKAVWELSPGNAVFYQQRTSPLTDREVLTIAANEISVEGLTDGERSALDIFKRLRLVQ